MRRPRLSRRWTPSTPKASASGYTLDQQIREAGAQANQSAVELERITARTAANADRIAELTSRLASGADDLAQAREQLASLAGELEQHRSFLENATAESDGSREAAQTQQAQAQEAVRSVAAAEQQAEQNRRASMQLMQRIGQTRNEEAQAAAALAGLEREAERLVSESDIARQELETLGLQRGQVALSFESVTERLKRLEAEIAELRLQIEARRAEESQTKRRGDQLRGEVATLNGRRNSLEALISEHSYSTDTVRNIFKTDTYKQNTNGMAAVGTWLTSSKSTASTRASSTSSFATSSTTSSSSPGTLPTPACICSRPTSAVAQPSSCTPTTRRPTSPSPKA